MRKWAPWLVVAVVLAIGALLPGLPGVVRFALKVALVLGMPLWALLLWLSGRMQPRAFRLLLFKLIVLGGVSVFALLVGELAARVALGDVTTTSDNASYFARRWLRDVDVNSHGFREREFEPRAPAGVFRIAVVGDSFTWGQGIAERERFSNRVELLLDERMPGTDWEVLNFGTAGHESEQHADTVRRVASEFDPDFVLVQWYANDMEGADKSGRPKLLPLVPSAWLTHRLHRNSALFFLVGVQWAKAQRALGLSGDYFEYLVERFEDPTSGESRRADAALRDILVAGASNDVPVGFVTFPHMNGRRDLDFLAARVHVVCEETDAPCLDLTPLFASWDDPRELWVNRFDVHPGAEANRVAAEAIVDRFGPRWAELAGE